MSMSTRSVFGVPRSGVISRNWIPGFGQSGTVRIWLLMYSSGEVCSRSAGMGRKGKRLKIEEKRGPSVHGLRLVEGRGEAFVHDGRRFDGLRLAVHEGVCRVAACDDFSG